MSSNSAISDLLMDGHSRFNIDMAASYIGKDQDLFDALTQLVLHSKPPLLQRAAWLLSVVTDSNPWLMTPDAANNFIDMLAHEQHPGLIRSILRYLASNSLPDYKKGFVINFCFNNLLNPKAPAAIRVHAMQVIFNESLKETDLKPELKLSIESVLDVSSAGFRNRAQKLLKRL